MAPRATKPLKIPEALSLRESFSSSNPSDYITQSIISGREAIKKKRQPMLSVVYPKIKIQSFL
jgi:hypothetical protein